MQKVLFLEQHLKYPREIASLSDQDCFLVMKRVRDAYDYPIQFHNDFFNSSSLCRSSIRPLKDTFRRLVGGILFKKQEVKKIASKLSKLSELDGMDYFMELFSITLGGKLLSAAERPADDFENRDRTKLLRHYIQQNCPKKIILDEVAQLLNMGKVFFDEFMKKKYQSYVC